MIMINKYILDIHIYLIHGTATLGFMEVFAK